MKRRLTDRQLAVYVAAKDLERACGAFPRAKELAHQQGCTGQNILEVFERLCERGWLERIGAGRYIRAREEEIA